MEQNDSGKNTCLRWRNRSLYGQREDNGFSTQSIFIRAGVRLAGPFGFFCYPLPPSWTAKCNCDRRYLLFWRENSTNPFSFPYAWKSDWYKLILSTVFTNAILKISKNQWIKNCNLSEYILWKWMFGLLLPCFPLLWLRLTEQSAEFPKPSLKQSGDKSINTICKCSKKNINMFSSAFITEQYSRSRCLPKQMNTVGKKLCLERQ